MADRKEMVGARIEQRKEEREMALKSKSSSDNIEEKVCWYYKELDIQTEHVEHLLQNCGGGEVGSQLDNIASKLSDIQKYITDSSIFLPAYDLKKSQGSFAGLTARFQETKDKVEPKKKFGFKNKRKIKPTEIIPNVTLQDEVDKVSKIVKDVGNSGDQDAFCVRDKNGETLIVRGNEASGRDLSISGLVNCKIEIQCSPSTIHITNISECTLLIGPTATSVFVEGCSDSTLAVSCQQLRTHHATRCKIYLHTTSRAIIEDCTDLQFAPYNWTYPGIDNDYLVSGLDKNINNWEKVGDFNWLATDTTSPNWCVIPEGQRISDWANVDKR